MQQNANQPCTTSARAGRRPPTDVQNQSAGDIHVWATQVAPICRTRAVPPAFAAATHRAGRANRKSANQPCTRSAGTAPSAAHGTDAASTQNP